MNVLVTSTSFPSKKNPHHGRFLARDVEGLIARGHRLTCLIARTRFKDGYAESPQIAGLTLYEAKYLSLSYVRGLEYPTGSIQQRNSTRALRKLLRMSAVADADVIYAKFLNTAPILPHVPRTMARVLGVGEGVSSVRDRLAFFKRNELQAYLDAADLVEVKNAEVAAWLSSHYACDGKIRIVPSGVDVDYFSGGDRSKARADLGIDAGKFVIASVGSRDHNKGGDRMLAAWRGCSRKDDIIPVMVGPGWSSDTRDWLGLGIVAPEVVRTVLTAADAFVLPSLSEGMPNALLEALAAGLPCIVADRPYAAFLQHDHDCLKVDPLSEGDFRMAFESLMSSPELRQRLSERAFVVASQMSLESRVRQVETVLSDAIAIRAAKLSRPA